MGRSPRIAIRQINYKEKFRPYYKPAKMDPRLQLRSKQNKVGATYQLAHNITKSTKLREFQFKLLHKRMPTNAFLTKIIIITAPFVKKKNK